MYIISTEASFDEFPCGDPKSVKLGRHYTVAAMDSIIVALIVCDVSFVSASGGQ